MKNTIICKPLRFLLLFFLIPIWLSAQTVSVRGVVKDINNEALIGVSVVEQGTTNATITNVDGTYNLNVPPTATLNFSYIGFRSQSIKLRAGQTQVDLVLEEDQRILDEVVVVGYGTQRRNDVTGAIVSTNERQLREIPAANVNQALQGQLAGISVQQTSTRPGQSGQVRIRGARSLTANNDPLVVLDGIPFAGTINDINTADIKSVDVLKDASATAIYGSRGANGVILITTHRGASDKPTVTYNGFYGIKTISEKYEVFNAEEFLRLREVAGNMAFFTKQENANLARWRETDGREGVTDWQDLLYKDGYVNSHDISIAGISQSGNYSFGAAYYGEGSVLPGQDFSRYALRSTIDQEIGSHFKFGATSQNSYSVTNGESASFMYQMLTMSPFAPPFNDDGTIVKQPVYPTDDYFNPLLVTNNANWAERRKRFSSFNSLYAEINILEGLKYRFNLGLSYFNGNYGNYFGSETPFRNGALSSAAVENEQQTKYTMENLLYYDKEFAKKHRLGFTALFSVEEVEYQRSRINATGLMTDYMQYYNLGYYNPQIGSVEVPYGSQSHYKAGLISYMFRANYAYASRYMATFSIRRDGSSRLVPNNRWHNYAAFSTGWNISNESFLQDVSWLSMLKLRAGYGQTANQAVSPYSTLGTLGTNRYNFGSENVYGFYVSNLPSYDLGWEYSNTWNVGLDFGFLGDRITGSLELYKQHTKDLLLAQSLPASSGVSGTVMKNVGQTENKGIELSLASNIINDRASTFTLDVNVNIAANRNKILKLNSGVDRDEANGWFVGEPIDVIYDYKKLGIWQLNEADEAESYGFRPGQIKIADIAGAFDADGNSIPDGRITEADRTIVGKLSPDFEGGFTIRMGYKGFDFTTVSYYHIGGDVISTLHQPQSYLNMLQGRRNQIKVDYWTPTHPTNAYPMPDGGRDRPLYGSTLGYFGGSFLKIRTMTLGYNIDKEILNKFNLNSARVYVTCQNPFVLFSPYMREGGVDPEPTGSGDQGFGGGTAIQNRQLTIGANTPPQRTFLIGLNLKF